MIPLNRVDFTQIDIKWLEYMLIIFLEFHANWHLCWFFYFSQYLVKSFPLQWRHNECDGVSNYQPHNCLLNRLFKAQIKELKLRVIVPVTGEFPAQRASNMENVSILWRHHENEGRHFKVFWYEPRSVSDIFSKNLEWHENILKQLYSHFRMGVSWKCYTDKFI